MEKLQKMVRGENVAHQEKTLSNADKKALSRAYFDLFFGLSGLNWANGDTLGAAWNKARGQIKAMLALKNKNNPAAMYLSQVCAAHAKRWAKEEMVNPYARLSLHLTGQALAKWKQSYQKMVGTAMAGINSGIGKWATPVSKMQLQAMKMMAQQKQRQRVA